jgi:predicted nucleic acid-binding Zn ribbon protein
MERIERSVEQELSRRGGGGAVALGALTAAWARAVGENVARNAWPLRVGRDGTLHVATSSSTWALELDRLGPEVLEKLSADLGEGAPARLRFAVGPVPEAAATEEVNEAPSPSADVAPEAAATASAAAAEIEDPELRELALRAARAALSRPPSDRRF